MIGMASALGVATSPATGHAEPECWWDEAAKTTVCRIVRRATAGGPPIRRDIDGPGPLPIIWSRQLSNGLPGAIYSCYSVETVGNTTTEIFGVGWAVLLTNRDTGEIRLAGFDCEYPGEDPPQPPPPPPTPGAIVEQSQGLTELTTGLSPSAARRGVSQLETWFWCDGAEAITLNPALDGYSIVAQIGVDGLVWQIDGPDGSMQRTADSCGSEPDPNSDGDGAAARWTPNEPGVTTIVQTATWAGSWSLTYTDPTFGPFDLGTFPFPTVPVVSAPISYEVYEIQTVGVATP